jgi:hypothetical protein
MIDVNNSLKRVVSLNVEGEGKKWCFIKYEKVPFFCKHCGRIGHNHEECGDGVWSIKEMQYGDLMLAMRRTNPPLRNHVLLVLGIVGADLLEARQPFSRISDHRRKQHWMTILRNLKTQLLVR